jgi:dipeptidyl aminopeptidase/acylaminoacyl peptidase
VEPEFRSSTGYGTKLFRAGWKQWGLSMQDDVADAARWAIAQGLADPKRMCVAGASYGGYATLMGLIRDPTLFRCGVQWVGVSDLDLLFSTNWQINHAAADFGLPELVGDREKDATQFAATSPLKLAAQLKQPLLMAYGGLDATVDLAHGTKMRNALRPHNPNVEWIEYADEGHDWMLEANNIDFWNRVERFLDRHLKNAP